MKPLLEQLAVIEAIVDTVNPLQIEQDANSVANRYLLYASSYNPLERVKILRDVLISEIEAGKAVNGYLSADYGYGKTATLVYLWHQCLQNQIMAVPPFKFKELENLMVATAGWIKAKIPDQFLPEFEELYERHNLQSLQEQANEVAQKFKISEKKAIAIIQQLKTNNVSSDNILAFWQETVILLQKIGIKGLAIFADECQEFLRTEEGSSVRIQILSDLVKGMRALGNTPVALILGMPTAPTESAIEEQAGDIIHRMKEQKVSLRLADAYNSEFPKQLWQFLGDKFLENKLQATQLAHPALIESLGQLCDRKDLSNGPRTTIEIFKRLVKFVQENNQPYTPLHLIEDYLAGQVQFYGAGQHRINHTIQVLENLPSVNKYPLGKQIIKLLAVFPAGLSRNFAKDLGVEKSLQELVNDDNLYGVHIIELEPDIYALTALAQAHTPTVVDKILNQFRQRWFRDWNHIQKQQKAAEIFRSEIMPILFPPSRTGQKANWIWHNLQNWQEDRFGFYNFLNGAPERYYTQFPKRSLVVSVGTEESNLMKFNSPQETHLDWRFYLNYNPNTEVTTQRLMGIAGTGQVDFYLQLNRKFEAEYPKSFGLLNKVIPAQQCSACTLLNLSHYIQDWLNRYSEVSKADRERLEQHRRECHQYALKLLFPGVTSENWLIEGLENIQGTETKLLESVFSQKCQQIFPNYQSFYPDLHPTLLRYKLILEKLPLVIRRGHQIYSLPKTAFESLFETTGSGLPSILKIFKANHLINNEKIAGKKEENSTIQLTQHPLELFIQQQILDQAINLQQLEEKVKRLGYLQEEMTEAIEWLIRRRYVEWNRQANIIYQARVELDADTLDANIKILLTKMSLWLNTFKDKLLLKINEELIKTEIKLKQVVNILEKEDSINQLEIFNVPVNNSEQKQSLMEVTLDEIQRSIKAIEQQLEEWQEQKYNELNQELNVVQSKLRSLNRDLLISKVNQPILGKSGLEDCLENYRNILAKQVIQLDKDCQHLANSIIADESDIFKLYYNKEESDKLLESYQATQQHLSALVAGLEQWRIILIRAEELRNAITDNPKQLKRYEDEFVDRVVTYFATYQLESFKQYEQLQRPLVEIEEQFQSEQRYHREAFNSLLNQYDSLVEKVLENHSSLSLLCRFDEQDHQGSLDTLRQVFLNILFKGYTHILSQWEKLEQDLNFLAQEREQDVNELLGQVKEAKNILGESKTKIPDLVEDLDALEEEINKIGAIASQGEKLQRESIRLQKLKDENLSPFEKQLVNKISSKPHGISISQFRQLVSGSDDTWEQVRNLYRKGYIEIIVNPR